MPSTPLATGVVYEAFGFTYDSAGRLASIVDGDGGAATYKYDATNLKDTSGDPCPDPPAWWLGEHSSSGARD